MYDLIKIRDKIKKFKKKKKTDFASFLHLLKQPKSMQHFALHTLHKTTQLSYHWLFEASPAIGCSWLSVDLIVVCVV